MPETTDDLERWRALRAQFANVTDPKKACRLPTPADIERFETEVGSRLPASFRGFTQVFGPGHLAVGRGWLRVYAAYAPEKPQGEYDIRRRVLKFRERWEKCSWLLGPQVYRLIVFGSDQSGDQYGWDPEDVTDPGAPEYGVYCWRHGDKDNAWKLTRTFEGFIRLFTNQTEFRTRLRARVSDPNVADPTFGYFKKKDGTEILGTQGRPLLREFEQLTYEYT
jgi:hypothetical protein